MKEFKKIFGEKWYITLCVFIGQIGLYLRKYNLWAIAGAMACGACIWLQVPLWNNLLITLGVALSLKAVAFILRVIGGLAMSHMIQDVMTMADKEGTRSWDEIKKKL